MSVIPARGPATDLWQGRTLDLADFRSLGKSADYTVTTADKGKTIVGSATLALTLPAATDGFWCEVLNDGASAGLVKVGSLVRLLPGEWVRIASDGSTFYVLDSRLIFPLGLGGRPPLVADAMDDEFPGTTLDAKWTTHNPTEFSVAVSGGRLTLSAANTATKFRGLTQPTPGVAYTAELAIVGGRMTNSFTTHGLWIRDSAGKHTHFSWEYTGVPSLIVQNWSSYTGFVATTVPAFTFGVPPVLRIVDDGTNFLFDASADQGKSFARFGSVARASYLTGGGNQVGICEDANGSPVGTAYAAFDYFRVTRP